MLTTLEMHHFPWHLKTDSTFPPPRILRIGGLRIKDPNFSLSFFLLFVDAGKITLYFQQLFPTVHIMATVFVLIHHIHSALTKRKYLWHTKRTAINSSLIL